MNSGVLQAMGAWAGVLVAMLAAAGSACAEAPLVIKFSHVVAADTPKGKAAEYFRRLVETKTGGRVKVEVYPNSELYKDRDELEALQLGAVQMLAPSLAKFGPLGMHEFEVFDLPYLFDSYAALHKVTDGPIGRELLERLEAKGIKGLAYWDNGFKQMSANRPLRSPEDFRGLKMRIQASRVLDSQMRALGAVPIATSFADAYPVLQTGVADGTENPLSNLYTQRMHEVQKYLTLSDHGYLGYALIVNAAFWDRLPRDLRSTLDATVKDATRYANEIARQENEQALARVRASGRMQVLQLDAAEKARWVRALAGVHRENEARIGSALIRKIYRETGFDPGRSH